MSAIVLAEAAQTASEVLTCVSVATGTKCLPVSSMPRCRGTVLHDSHAEVLALRALNRFLLAEIEHLVRGEGYESRWVAWRDGSLMAGPLARPFVLRSSVSVHMFSTEAPCGDASMGLLIGSKAEGDSEAWPEPDLEPDAGVGSPQLHGRGYFSVLGAVRRKPARADAEPTLSKSCTDKLALKQVTSVLAFPTSLFIERTANTYLKSVVLPGEKYDADGFARAFGPDGRLAARPFSDRTVTSPAIHYFEIETLPRDSARFAYEKCASTDSTPSTKAGNVSALWVRGSDDDEPLINETLVNGVKQGSKQFSESSFKTSAVSRKNMWQHGRVLVSLLQQRERTMEIDRNYLSQLEATLTLEMYSDAKESMLDRDRGAAKEYAMLVLGGWKKNEGDGDWGLQKQSRTR